MLPNRIQLEPNILKKSWNSAEIDQTKQTIDRYFAITADWDHSASDMGLTYQVDDQCAKLNVAGDFYLDEGVRMLSFLLTDSGDLILKGEEDEESGDIYYLLEDH